MTKEEVKVLEKIFGSKSKVLFKRNTCKKCGSVYNVIRHHVTYKPPMLAFLCCNCHAVITAINTVAAMVTGVNKDNNPVECNKIRTKLWKWFISKKRSISIGDVTKFLGHDREFSDGEIEYIANAGKRCINFKNGGTLNACKNS